MRLRQLFEAPRTAVMAFGRMNPPTIGHAKLVDAVKSQGGDPYIFLSQSQKPKTDPLPFEEKLRYAKFFFPNVTIGNPEVRTIIQALQKLSEMGYENLVYVAGSDRVASFQELIKKYNGVEYNFKSIKVVSAGERDPDADGAEGMSASKMRAAAAAGDLESFSQGVPKPELAQKMYDAVRTGMGVKDKETTEASYEGNIGIMELMKFFTEAGKEAPELVAKVKNLIKKRQDKEVWKIVQDYTGTKLKGAEFEGAIIDEILGFATKRPKTATIKKKRPPEEDSVQDKIAKRRAMAAKGDPNAFKSGSK